MSVELLVPQHRRAVEALWQIDAAMGDVVARSTEPRLGKIKLAWWREQLEQLDCTPPPAEPRLKAAAAELLPRGLSGTQLAAIEPGWATLFDEPINHQLIADRGARLFTMISTLLGKSDEHIGEAGALWALVAVGKRGQPDLLEAARAYASQLKGHRFPMGLRGLSLLARLAALDLKHGATADLQGTRRRARSLIGHMWMGTVSP